MSSVIFRRASLHLRRRQVDFAHPSLAATSAGCNNLHRLPSPFASRLLRASLSSYPSHEVVGLPALSPVGLQDLRLLTYIFMIRVLIIIFFIYFDILLISLDIHPLCECRIARNYTALLSKLLMTLDYGNWDNWQLALG